MFNISATLNVSRLFFNPALCLPHSTVRSFDQLTFPLPVPAKIRGVVLDKDNCFAQDHDDKVWPTYLETWQKLKDTYPNDHLLIVSNSAGTNDDINFTQANTLATNTGVTVFKHLTKKPGCHEEILNYFKEKGIENHEIAVIGDRLFTDMLMANMMGSWGIWLQDGVKQSQKLFPSIERDLYARLVTNKFGKAQWNPPVPRKSP